MAETDIKKPAPIKAKAAATDTAVTTISKEKKKFFSFRHKPLVRVGKDIFYGNINDACVCMVKILKTESKNDVEVATATKVYLLPSENADPRSPEFLKTIMSARTVNRGGLYDALELAYEWLTKT